MSDSEDIDVIRNGCVVGLERTFQFTAVFRITYVLPPLLENSVLIEGVLISP